MGERSWGAVCAGMRGGRRAVLAAMAALVLAGCAVPESAAPSSPPSGPPDPIALVGMWTLTGVGAADGTVVGLAPGELRIFQGCGELFASWSADTQGLFVAGVTGSTGGCDPRVRVGWLEEAAGYRLDGGGQAVLVDVAGGTVARLVASGVPPRPDRESFEVTDEFRRFFDSPAVLPRGLSPAGRRELAGRWVPVRGGAGAVRQPYLELRGDGRWSASDGCNGSEGGWVAGAAGTLLATSGVSTLIGCDNVPVGEWLSSARRAGFDGQTLVLLDQGAKELGRLRRAGVTTPPSGGPGALPPAGG